MSRHDSTRRPLRRPANYRSRREQYRLLMLVFSLMLVLLLMFEAAKPSRWEWMWQLPGPKSPASSPEDPSIDTRISPQQNTASADVFRAAAPTPTAAAAKIDRNMLPEVAALDLSELRDNTVLRGVERQAWNGLFDILQRTDRGTLVDSSVGCVGFTQLFRQPEAYRGRTVTVAGTVRRAFPLAAVANEFGVQQCWQCWLFPEGSLNPIVVYSLDMPEGFPAGMSLREHVEFVGIFYKRWAYAAQRSTRTAPLILAKLPTWQPSPPPVVVTPITMAEVAQVVLLSALAALAFTWLIFFRTRSSDHSPVTEIGPFPASPERPAGGGAGEIGAPTKTFGWVVLGLLFHAPLAVAQDTSGRESSAIAADSTSVQTYLELFELGPSQLAEAAGAAQAPGTSSQADHQALLHVFQCLSRCPVAVLSSHALVIDDWLKRTDPLPCGQIVRLRGRLESLAAIELPVALQQRTGRKEYFGCVVSVEMGQNVQLLADQLPKRWLTLAKEQLVGQRISCWALLLSNDGTSHIAAGQGVAPGTNAPPPAPVFVTQRISWHPAAISRVLGVEPEHVLLANHGLDVGQLDEVQLRGRLSSEDRAAFYQLLLAVGRIEDDVLRAAARNVNVTQLLQHTETHVGKLYEIVGNARRCVRVLVDDADVQAEFGLSSYYELVVFLDPDAILKIRSSNEDAGKYFATYPVVVCVRHLPEGFPEGEDIHAGVRVVGAYLKMWAYPSEFTQTSGANALQFSPLLIGNLPQLIRPTGVRDPLSGPGIPVAFATVLIFLCGLVWWWNRGDDRFQRETLARKYDLPADVVLDDQDFEAEHE